MRSCDLIETWASTESPPGLSIDHGCNGREPRIRDHRDGWCYLLYQSRYVALICDSHIYISSEVYYTNWYNPNCPCLPIDLADPSAFEQLKVLYVFWVTNTSLKQLPLKEPEFYDKYFRGRFPSSSSSLDAGKGMAPNK